MAATRALGRAHLVIEFHCFPGTFNLYPSEALGVLRTLFDAPAPILRAFSPETVVAEKTETIVSLGDANSRMKDFYDLWMMAQTFTFQGGNLANGMQQTFERCRTPLPEQIPVGLNDRFALEREAQWRAFLARSWLATASNSIVQVVNDLRAFPQPVLARTDVASWPPGRPQTEVNCR